MSANSSADHSSADHTSASRTGADHRRADRPNSGAPLAGRRVLVTGASSGIGAATARAVVAAGGRVALVARSKDRLDALAGELEQLGADPGSGAAPRAVVVTADVVDPASARAAVDAAAAGLGGLDAVVNAAGVARPGPIATTSPSDWQLTFDVNVRGLLHVTQAALPHLTAAVHAEPRAAAPAGAATTAAARGDAPAGAATTAAARGDAPAAARGDARAEAGSDTDGARSPADIVADIVNVSSMSGRRVGSPAMGVYAASKAAVHALSGALRSEVSGDGIRVSVIAPGFVRTPIFEGQDTEAARTLGVTGEEVGLPPEQVADRIVEVLAAPPGLVHVEVAMTSIDQG